MKSYFKELFDYTYHHNREIILLTTARTDAAINEKHILLLNHTINAHEIWNLRIKDCDCKTGVWEIRTAAQIEKQNHINYKTTLEIIENTDFEKVISYTNSKGHHYTNIIKDILFHIINHSTYHRGQIMANYKQEGGTPLVSDYIFYKRQINS